MKIELYFDGFCPESMLKGKQVEMKLNEDDFWESVETGLQMTVFPPFATILGWRGKGKLKQSSENASEVLTGLVMTKAQKGKGNEIFPDENEIIGNKSILEIYLSEVINSEQEQDDAVADPIKNQEHYLSGLKQKDFIPLFEAYDALRESGYVGKFRTSRKYQELFDSIRDLKLIFPFDWTSWEQGKQNINDKNFNYNSCSLVQLSMYITTIFRAEKFNEGVVEEMFINGTLDKIFEGLLIKIQHIKPM